MVLVPVVAASYVNLSGIQIHRHQPKPRQNLKITLIAGRCVLGHSSSGLTTTVSKDDTAVLTCFDSVRSY